MDAPLIYTTPYYERIRSFEERHWWYVGMRSFQGALYRAYAGPDAWPRRALDAGCGTGATMSWLEEQYPGIKVVGVDIASDAVQLCRQEHSGVNQGSVLQLPYPDDTYDLVISQDVIQHLPTEGGDTQALREMLRVLRPGGIALIRSNSRLGMGHTAEERDHDFQRYLLPELKSRFEDAGFTRFHGTYANALPAVYATLKRRLRRRSSGVGKAQSTLYEGLGVRDTAAKSPLLNRILMRWMRVEAWYVSKPGRALPFGHSTICLGTKPPPA